jgi:hypothetical protein
MSLLPRKLFKCYPLRVTHVNKFHRLHPGPPGHFRISIFDFPISTFEFCLPRPTPVRSSGIHTGTPHSPLACSPYNEFMQRSLMLLGVCLVFFGGCKKQPEMDYSALDQSGMWSTNLDTLKKQNVTAAEVAQLAKLKQAGASDDLCLALFKAARDHQHDFSSGSSAVNLSRAGYSDEQILEMAKSDQIDILSGDAVMLKLIGLSNPTVQAIMSRRMQGLPTLTSAQIGRLKNTAMSEKQILEIVDQGLSNEQAEALITQREAVRNHSNTGFVRVHGRKPR